MHKLIFAGTLTKDGVKRYTQSGQSVLDLNFAVNDFDGKQKTTIWIKGSLWGKRADALEQYLLKGTRCMVDGKLVHQDGNPRIWGEQEKRASFEVMVNDIELMGGKQEVEQEDFF